MRPATRASVVERGSRRAEDHRRSGINLPLPDGLGHDGQLLPCAGWKGCWRTLHDPQASFCSLFSVHRQSLDDCRHQLPLRLHISHGPKFHKRGVYRDSIGPQLHGYQGFIEGVLTIAHVNYGTIRSKILAMDLCIKLLCRSRV